jgi:hypothetical protein
MPLGFEAVGSVSAARHPASNIAKAISQSVCLIVFLLFISAVGMRRFYT